MAASKNDSTNIIDNATQVMEETAVKAQDQYFALLERGQAAVIETFETVLDTVNRVDVPTIPGFDAFAVPSKAVDNYFGFAAKVVDNQREFAAKMLAATNKA